MLALVSSPSKYASLLQTYSFMCNISALDYRKTLCELAKINDRKRLQKLPWLMPPIKPQCTTQRTETDQMRKRELKVLNSSLFKYICSRWEERRKTKYVFLCLRKKCSVFFFSPKYIREIVQEHPYTMITCANAKVRVSLGYQPWTVSARQAKLPSFSLLYCSVQLVTNCRPRNKWITVSLNLERKVAFWHISFLAV